MQLDNLDISIIKRALENPGIHQKELYRPLRNQRSETFLLKQIHCLEACGFLELRANPGTVQVFATPRAKRHIKKLAKRDTEAGQCKP